MANPDWLRLAGPYLVNRVEEMVRVRLRLCAGGVGGYNDPMSRSELGRKLDCGDAGVVCLRLRYGFEAAASIPRLLGSLRTMEVIVSTSSTGITRYLRLLSLVSVGA